MKGKLLTLAVAAAIVAPLTGQAAEIYGRAQAGLQFSDNGDTDVWDVGSGGHARWGIVGSEDLGNGLKGIYKYEFNMAGASSGDGSTVGAESTRVFSVGLSGDFGTLKVGRDWLPVFGRLAPPASWVQGGRNVSRAYVETIGTTRSGNLISYDLPKMGAFSAGIGVTLSDEQSGEDGIDRWAIGASYKEGPLFIGGAYETRKSVGFTAGSNAGQDEDYWGIAANYAFDAFKLRGAYYANDKGATEDSGWVIGVEGKFDNNTVYAFYEDWSTKDDTVDNDLIRLLFHHHMSKTFRLFAEYNHRETEGKDDYDTFEVGFLQFWKL